MTGETFASRSGDGPWRWCRDPGQAVAVARFFVAQAGPAYISHSELQFGRASAVGRWSDDLAARIEAEARRAVAPAGAGGLRCAIAPSASALAGLAFVRFVRDADRPFAVIEDLLVDAARRDEGLGTRCLAWIEEECRAEGFFRLFLESGLANHAAHDFFERRGFSRTSVVMMRDLAVS